MVVVFIIRVPYIFPNGFEVNLTRGENYYFQVPLNKAFLWAHIAAVLPAGLLVIIQFIPRIRARAINVHRTAGKIVFILTFISIITAWGVTRVSFGGDLASQSGMYTLGAMILWSTTKAWLAIRRLDIDEHRAWVIRAWSYYMSVVTLRLIMVVAMTVISLTGGLYQAIPCGEVAYILNNRSEYSRKYPQCQAEWTGPRVTHVSVEANVIDDTNELGFTAALQCVFGMSTWVGMWIHAIGTEYYLLKTKDESDRLREAPTKRRGILRALRADQPGAK
ncbi:hypothetical protein FRC12_024105 [Ceratobasidium sp. 428]|nr:hypothetical protein FRC09_014387 [Ceratobasidium sp. 395]KAG8779557.1 hypothetical protein FRC12_024105 [Ceratobasidium sp. 428]